MRLLKSGLLTISVVLCFATSSCVTTKAEGEQMMADIAHLKNELSALQRERSDFAITIDKRIGALEGVTYKQSNIESMESEKLRREVASLRGELEEALRGLGHIQKPAHKEVAPVDKKEHFLWAKEAFDNGDYSIAFVRVEGFNEKYKDDSQYGANAYLLKGDAAVMLGKNAPSKPAQKEFYKKAVAAYQDLLTRFPKSPRIPEGLYKVGETLESMGFKKDAKIFYQEVRNNHKKSSYAKKASKKLQTLNKKRKK